MSDCPSEEKLASLLEDALSPSDRDALAQHIEACTYCQAKLAQLAEGADDPIPNRYEPSTDSTAGEDEMVRRLKSARRTPPPFDASQADTPTQGSTPSYRPRSASVDVEIPSIPGYEILSVLGRGGTGVVFKVRQEALRRVVALKMLQDSARAGTKELTRFRAEADAIGRLQHPNIVQVYDVGEIDGKPFFVLEYVPGGNLGQHLNGTPQSPNLAAEFVEILARAVHAAHANGVIHRDLKPSNILLSPAQGNAPASADAPQVPNRRYGHASPLRAIPKIADFGVAKVADHDGEGAMQRSLTVTGELLGTPSYMAPEQAAPSAPSVGPAADIYALGAILYELLTGRPPFKGETALDTVLQVLHNDLVAVTDLQPNVPRDLETICLKCLRREPRHRYESAADLADDIHSFLCGEQIKARPRGTVEKVWRWVRDHPVPSALVAVGVCMPFVALLILSLLSARLARSAALESSAQQAELLELATNQYSKIVQRVEQADYTVNKMVPPTPETVPLSIPATFLHDVGEALHVDGKTGIQVRQYSEEPFPWRRDGGPHDDFEREALRRLRQSNGQETVHAFATIDGEPVVRFAQARIMKQSCVDCHNQHPLSTRKDWKVGDVRGVLEIIRPLKHDEARVTKALQLTLFLSVLGSALLLSGSILAVWAKRWRIERRP